ncbi:PREDICTED: uncharacterized protein LOC109243273 [Nicotiana attenuata]|uniref:uncharacterized protein LOC109243273 n=1 Tax=Nicotiana attenuata TaxID=49451 RepID=UPI00090578F3|nr:PREDICTED: uncharacterized protein LOC109243273 [Nicotiana attenuata]
MLSNKPIIVKVWSADFDFTKEVLQTIPVWVKYPNLPLNCWGQKSLSRISSGAGVPLYADACTTQIDRISYARVLVEMDVTKELPTSIKVTDPNGREFMQEIAYDWVPEFCTKCIKVGHQCRVVDQSGLKGKSKYVNQKQEWQPKLISKVQEPAKEQVQLKEIITKKNASTNAAMASTSAGSTGNERGHEEQRCQTIIGKPITRSRERQSTDVVSVINGFNLLAESNLQLVMPRQIEGGAGRQQGDTGQEDTLQPLFIPKAEQVIRKITPGWAYLDNYEHSSKERIWLLWDTNEIECKEVSSTAQTIHTVVYIRRLDMRFTFTAVYGLHSIEDRRSMWSELTRLHSIQQGPWLIMGDYNAIRSIEDRPVGNTVQDQEVRDFNEFIEDTGVTEMKTNGRKFTWTNGHTYSKIDRALINADWMLVTAQMEVLVMDPHCSDHSPLSITLEEEEDFSPKPFKFLNHLAEHDDFVKIVKEAWERP